MGNQFSFKELENVVLKTTYPIEIKNKQLEVGEVIAYFDKIQIANFQQILQTTDAEGGFDNRKLIIWRSTREVDFTLQQGIFNQTQFNVMVNAGLVVKGTDTSTIHQREIYGNELPATDYLCVNHIPNKNYPVYAYDPDGNKLKYSNPEVELIGEKYKVIGSVIEPSKEYVVDYKFDVEGGEVMKIGHELISGFVELEGRTKVQDDVSGEFRTGIIKIPKLKLMSDLSIRLGANSTPVAGILKAIGVPTGARGKEEVMEIIFLDDEIE